MPDRPMPVPFQRLPWPLLLFALLFASQASADLDCKDVGELSIEFLRDHVSQRDRGPEIERRAIEMYLQRLDTSRSLMLSSEVEALSGQLQGVFEKVSSGDCQQLDLVHGRLVELHERAEKYVAALLDDPEFSLDESVEIEIDPDKRGHPADAAERDELLRRLVHFQISNYLEAGEDLDEAKRMLAHRYELHSSRTRDLEKTEMLSLFLDAFASALDPHSAYLSPEAVEDFRISMSLSLEGIGVALADRDGYSVVERIIPGGAADRLGANGLKTKDKIIAVAEEGGEAVSIIDMPLRDAVSLIRGKKGTKVQLTVLRQDETTERFTLTIVRDKIDLAEQAASLRFETRERAGKTYKLAVLELPSFYGDSDPDERQCTDDVEKLLAQAVEEKADGLMLDLSRNGGGLLEHAVRISGFFIRKGEVVGVQNKNGDLSVMTDRDERVLYAGPMVVHVSRVSASASEILAGALKDYRRAVITGDDHTYGKGTVQTVRPLPNRGALKVTTARFFRPGGRSTQNDGVQADVEIPSELATDDLGERHQRYALGGEQIEAFLGSYANAIGEDDRWSRVSPVMVELLAEKSSQRVEKNDAFDEVREHLAEAEENDGVVRLSDILKRREEAKAKAVKAKAGPDGDDVASLGSVTNGDGGANEPDHGEELTPQAAEALEVLADLIFLTREQPSQRQAVAQEASGGRSR